MYAFATQRADDRRAVFVETAARMGAAASVIAEKDFWVCFALHHLFALDFRPSLLFKGGTSLSKAFGLIDRFSEDIDLTLNRAELGFSGADDPIAISGRKARQRKIDALAAECARVIRDDLEPALRASIEYILGRENWALESVALEDDQVDLRFHYPPRCLPRITAGSRTSSPSCAWRSERAQTKNRRSRFGSGATSPRRADVRAVGEALRALPCQAPPE